MNSEKADNFLMTGRLTRPSDKLTEPGDRRNAALLSGLLLVIMSLGLLNGIVQLIFVPDFFSVFIFILVGVSLMGVAYGFSRTEHYRVGGFLAALIPSLISYLNFVQNPDDAIAVGFMVVGVLVGSMFLSMAMTALIAVLNLAGVLLLPVLAADPVESGIVSGAFGFVVMLCGLILLTKYHRSKVEEDRQQVLLQTQARLQSSYDQLRNVLDHMPVLVCALDNAGKVAMWNSEAERVTGMAASEVLDHPFPTAFPEWHTAHLSTEHHSEPVEVQIRNKHQEMTTLSFQRMSDQFPIPGWSAWGVALDVTARRRHEQLQIDHERLKISFQKENEHNRLVQRIIATLSHDMRAPLTVILTARDFLVRYSDSADPQKRREKLDAIARQIEYAVRLLEDTVNMVRGSSDERGFRPQPVNLAMLCQVSLEEIRFANRTQHRFEFINKTESPTLAVDETLVTRILINLLSNAIKYSPDGSEIRLQLEHDDGWITLQVADSGRGISADDLPYIFDPFFRTEDARTIAGTGLGLNIVKECVDRHRGRIQVESEVGQGTRFTVKLPIMLDKASAVAG